MVKTFVLFVDDDTEADDALDTTIYENRDPLSCDHLALHLPKCKGCSGCDMGKTLKSNSRRRKRPKVFVSPPDATTQPFGAMVHLDTIAMEPNSEASQAARYCLNVHDERTSFRMAFPSHKRDAGSVVDAMHRFDDDCKVIRHRWTDAAHEFISATGRIRAQRPLAHYMSAPYRPQASGRAERSNRLMIEGTRCFLLQAAFGERWWPLAIKLWCMNYNALHQGPDGFTPWQRRFGMGYEFKAYRFGAFALYTHPKKL